MTAVTVISTATQTLDDWMELQKVQHNMQYALNKRRDSSGSHSPTALLEQIKERLQSIAQDMYIVNKSCGEEIVRSSLARARKAAPKKRRRARRNRGRPVKQVCSDTIEESIPSTDEVTLQRKRARVYKRSPPSSTTQIRFSTSCHLHITVSLQQQHSSPHHLSHVGQCFWV